MSERRDAAVAYTERGWKVIPCCPPDCTQCNRPGKTPTVFFAGSPESARERWQTLPNANVGILLPNSGMVVIDIDGPDGVGAIESAGLPLPPTLTAQTGRGDSHTHHYYRRPPGMDYLPTVINLLNRVDMIAGQSGHVVAPPSIHKSGVVYKWLNDARLEVLPMQWIDAARDALLSGRCDPGQREDFVASGESDGEYETAVEWARSQQPQEPALRAFCEGRAE